MSFMNLYTHYGDWYVVDTTAGTEIIDADLLGEIPEYGRADHGDLPNLIWKRIKDFVEVCNPEQVYSIEKQTGWCARYSAPGYLDCTSWVGPYETEEEAVEECESIYEED